MSRFAVASVCLSLCGWLAACDHNPQAELDGLYDGYVAKLSRVLQQPVPARQDMAGVPRYPARRLRRAQAPDVRIGPLQAIGLHQCSALQRLVGERNSGLGRVMAASQQLAYEAAFLPEARACIEQLQQADKQGAADELLAAMSEKHAALVVAQHNVLFDSDEVAAFWSVSARPRLAAPGVLGYQPGDLERLAAIVELAGQRALEADEVSAMEAVLQRLSSGGGGQVLVNTAETVARLQQATALVDARLQRRRVCFEGHDNPTATVFRTVVHQVFAGQVQPELAALSAQLAELDVGLSSVIAEQSERRLPESGVLQSYAAAVAGRRAGLREAIADHVRALQQVLQQCGMLPGAAHPQP